MSSLRAVIVPISDVFVQLYIWSSFNAPQASRPLDPTPQKSNTNYILLLYCGREVVQFSKPMRIYLHCKSICSQYKSESEHCDFLLNSTI